MARPVRFLAVSVLVITVATACGSSSTDSSADACAPVVEDQIDPGSGTHLLPGAPTPSYIVDPPTSGAHQPAPMPEGPATEPITPQLQVGYLEQGRVIIQYADITDDAITELEQLNSDDVLVAPGADLPDDTEVVATAWLHHQNCTAVDIDTLEAFAAEYAGTDSHQH